MLGLARVRDRRARRDRRAAVGALGELFGARGAGEEVVARPEDDGPRRVGLHADRAQEAVLERLLLLLDPGEHVLLGLLALEAGRGRCCSYGSCIYGVTPRLARGCSEIRSCDESRRLLAARKILTGRQSIADGIALLLFNARGDLKCIYPRPTASKR